MVPPSEYLANCTCQKNSVQFTELQVKILIGADCSAAPPHCTGYQNLYVQFSELHWNFFDRCSVCSVA